MEQLKQTIGKLKIGDKIANLPIIQGGMGVGVSRSSLAGAVAGRTAVSALSPQHRSAMTRKDLSRIRQAATFVLSRSIFSARGCWRRILWEDVPAWLVSTLWWRSSIIANM